MTVKYREKTLVWKSAVVTGDCFVNRCGSEVVKVVRKDIV